MTWDNMTSSLRNKIQVFWIIAGLSFVSNLIWENLQASLYQGYTNFWNHFSICFVATIGDVLITLLIFGIFAVAYKNFYWFMKMSPRLILLVVVMGGLIAIILEKWSLESGRWTYASMMPVIPFLKVGLFPILQMIVIPVIVFCLVFKIIDHKKLYEI